MKKGEREWQQLNAWCFSLGPSSAVGMCRE
jgi:hypothetical protein